MSAYCFVKPMNLLINAAKKHQSGDLKRAVGLYQAFLRENAEHAEALNLYGLCMHELGNFQDQNLVRLF